MILGYFLTNSILGKSFITGFTDVPSDCIQGALSVAAAYVLALVLSRINALRTLTDNVLCKPLPESEHTPPTEEKHEDNADQ